MSRDMNIIHRLLDGEISEEERKDILNKIDSDAALKDEFNRIEKTIRIVSSDRLIAPASFTSDVMKRLPARGDSYMKMAKGFLFKGRVLRWNMAAALATVCLLIIAFAGIFQSQKKDNLASHINTSSESAITVKFNIYVPDAKKVAIAGDFNKWKTNERIMKKQDNGIWTIEIPLNPGTYNYMFVVDGKAWMTDPNAESYQDDGFGFKNSVLKVTKL
ncbi:MAG: isoamylase early set domain-containing protein [Nitrospiraceae bacterium]|nr:isoamylase early set domain-containing protein [Nitrospiraceae bacterium]